MAQSLRSIGSASSWFTGSLSILLNETAVNDVLVFIGSGDSQGTGFVPLAGWTVLHDLTLTGMRHQVHYMLSPYAGPIQLAWTTDHFSAMGALLSIAGATAVVDKQSSVTMHTSSFGGSIPVGPINTLPDEYLVWAATGYAKTSSVFYPGQLTGLVSNLAATPSTSQTLTVAGRLFAGGTTPATWCNGNMIPDDYAHASIFAFKNPVVAINPQLFSEV